MNDIVWGAEIVTNAEPRSDLAYSPMQYRYNNGQSALWQNYTGEPKNWDSSSWRVVRSIRLPADHPYYARQADTVTIARMTEADLEKRYEGRVGDWAVYILADLGLIKPDPTPLDRFMEANPDADRATAEKALAFER